MTELEVKQQLKEAIRQGNLDKFSSLVNADLSRLKIMTVFGTWLHVATSDGKLEFVKWLVGQGRMSSTCGGPARGGALNEAASDGHYDVVEYLLDHGAVLDVSEPERNPRTARWMLNYNCKATDRQGRPGVNTGYIRQSGGIKNALSFARDYGRSEIEVPPVLWQVMPPDRHHVHLRSGGKLKSYLFRGTVRPG